MLWGHMWRVLEAPQGDDHKSMPARSQMITHLQQHLPSVFCGGNTIQHHCTGYHIKSGCWLHLEEISLLNAG